MAQADPDVWYEAPRGAFPLEGPSRLACADGRRKQSAAAVTQTALRARELRFLVKRRSWDPSEGNAPGTEGGDDLRLP